jgi:tetratricopeptide (TPR) repeat protein
MPQRPAAPPGKPLTRRDPGSLRHNELIGALLVATRDEDEFEAILQVKQDLVDDQLVAALSGRALQDQDEREQALKLADLLGRCCPGLGVPDPDITAELQLAAREAALQWSDKSHDAGCWASIQVELAKTYCARDRGDPSDNHEEAIRRCRLALDVFSQKGLRERWAGAQVLLGDTLCSRTFSGKEANLDSAIECFRQAIEVFRPESFPDQWTDAQEKMFETMELKGKLDLPVLSKSDVFGGGCGCGWGGEELDPGSGGWGDDEDDEDEAGSGVSGGAGAGAAGGAEYGGGGFAPESSM